MKKFLSILLAFTMLISASAFSVAAYAVEYVAVYVNGTAIDFPSTDARPQIIDNRTYVPVRKTCEALGLELDWNSKTETMTLTRDGITIAHTMRSKVVYVNGTAVQFDTASINRNNRILMPIRMIAESVGATVTWDDPTRSVHITTTTDSSSDNTSSNTSSDASSAVVNTISASKTAVAKDADITITAVCSKETEKVKFVRTNDSKTIETVTSYTENSDGTRSFVAEYTCENDTDDDQIYTIQAVPGTSSDFNENTSGVKSVSFMVSGDDSSNSSNSDADDDYKSEYMLSCKLSSDEIKTDDYAKVKVKTTSDVKKVKLTSDANAQQSVTTDYDEDDDGNRTFNCKLEMSREGDWELYVTLYVSGDYEDVNETFDVSVDDSYDEASGSDDLEIIDMWTNNKFGYKGYDTTLYVKTSTDVKYLELLTEDQDAGEGKTTRSTAGKYSNYYYWEFDFEVKQTGDMTYKLLAYNDDGDYTSDTFDLEGMSVSRSEPAVLYVDQKTDSIIEGEEAKFNVIVTGCVTRLKVTRGSSRNVYDEEFSYSSSTNKTVNVTFEVDDVDAEYSFVAYNEDGDSSDKYKFKLTGDVEQEIEVVDIDVKDTTVDEEDLIEITVTTSNSATKVWVEDDRENQISRIYKSPSEEDGSYLIWEIEFAPIDTGRQTFTVKAQDDNKKEDSDDFKITVK